MRFSTLVLFNLGMLSAAVYAANNAPPLEAHLDESVVHQSHDDHDHVAGAQVHDKHPNHDHTSEEQVLDVYDGHGHDGEEHDHDHAAEEQDHYDHADESMILSPDQRQALGIVEAQVQMGILQDRLTLYGETHFDAEKTVHVLPLLNGSVKAVYKQLGDYVQAGEALALLESRELADAQSAYLTALEQFALVKDDLRRKKQLLNNKVLPRQQLFTIQQSLAEAKIHRQATKRKLHALGFSETYIKRLPKQAAQQFTKYTLTAPQSGVIVEKHITRGEVFRDESRVDAARAFVITDLSSLWVDFRVYPQDLPRIKVGQTLSLAARQGMPANRAKIIYIAPQIDRETRTALVRARLANPRGQYRAGLFVQAELAVKHRLAKLLIPLSSVIRSGDETQVFVREASAYELRDVRLGEDDGVQVEVLTGLQPGEIYVAQGAFILKAEQDKSAFAHAGHAH